MREDTKNIHGETRDEAAPLSGGRRRLLKAAAAATPVIATLPSSLAAQIANNSTAECVLKDRAESDTESGDPAAFDLKDSMDKWVRVTTTLETQTKTFTVRTPTEADPDATEEKIVTRAYYKGTNPFAGDEDFYIVAEIWEDVPAADNVIPPPTPTSLEIDLNSKNAFEDLTTAEWGSFVDWTLVGVSDPPKRYALVMWLETETGGFVDGISYVNIFPDAKRTDNMGATPSCLCSVNPNSPICLT